MAGGPKKGIKAKVVKGKVDSAIVLKDRVFKTPVTKIHTRRKKKSSLEKINSKLSMTVRKGGRGRGMLKERREGIRDKIKRLARQVGSMCICVWRACVWRVREWCVRVWCACVARLYVARVCVSRVCVAYVCVAHVYVACLCVAHLCVAHLCLAHVCVRSCCSRYHHHYTTHTTMYECVRSHTSGLAHGVGGAHV